MNNKENYYCDGICEECEKGKYYKDPEGDYYTCDEDKIKGLNIIVPLPQNWRNNERK